MGNRRLRPKVAFARDVAGDRLRELQFASASFLAQEICARVRATADARNADVVLHCSCGDVWVQPAAFSDALRADGLRRAENARGYPVMLNVRHVGAGGAAWQSQNTWRWRAVDGRFRACASADNHRRERRHTPLRVGAGVDTTTSIWLRAHRPGAGTACDASTWRS